MRKPRPTRAATILTELLMPPDPEPTPAGPLAQYWDADGQLIEPGARTVQQIPIEPHERGACPTHTAPGRPCDGSYTNCPKPYREQVTFKSETVKAVVEDGPRKGTAWVTVRNAGNVPPAHIDIPIKGVDTVIHAHNYAHYRRVDELPVLTYRAA